MPRKSRKFICEKCGEEFYSRKKKVRFCSNKCRASVIRNFLKNNKPANYIEGKIRDCKICGASLHSQTKSGYCIKHYATTDEHRKKLSEIAKKNKYGGYYKGSGRGKSGWYKGYWCDSSWELAWVIYNLEHGIEFERNKKGFEYLFENQTYKYYPDFKINDKYIEIKGWLDEKNKAKIHQFKGNLEVLYEKDLAYIFTYVKEKYGKDFIKLYEIKQGCSSVG